MRYGAGDGPCSAAIGDLDAAGAGAAPCTHPLFVFLNPSYDAGSNPRSVAIGDLDGVNGLDLAVANEFSDDVSMLRNLCDTCVGDLDGDGVVGVLDLRPASRDVGAVHLNCKLPPESHAPASSMEH